MRPLLWCLLVLFAAPLFAAPGSLDPAFGAPTRGYQSGQAMAVQPDGKLLIGMDRASVELTADFVRVKAVARFEPDGTLDQTFSIGVNFVRSVLLIQVEADGGILVGGAFDPLNSVPLAGLARFLPDGTLDPNFLLASGSGDSTPSVVRAVARQPDGKRLVGGNFSSYAGLAANRLVRVNADGTRDTSFQPGVFQTQVSTTTYTPGGTITHLAVQPNGAMLVAGTFNAHDGAPAPYADPSPPGWDARYNVQFADRHVGAEYLASRRRAGRQNPPLRRYVPGLWSAIQPGSPQHERFTCGETRSGTPTTTSPHARGGANRRRRACRC